MKSGSNRMGRAAVLAGLSVLLAAPALRAGAKDQATAQREFNKTLPLDACCQTLAVENKFGEVRVHGESGNEVKIKATIRAQGKTQEKADKRVDEIHIEVTQDAKGAKVRTVYTDEPIITIRLNDHTSYSVDYDISVPAKATLWVKNAFGNVNVLNVQSWTEVVNSNGNISLHDAGAAKLTNSFGSVETANTVGKLLVINTNGPVTVQGVKGDIDVKDRFAAITVSGVQGLVSISGGNGAVELTDVGAATVNSSFGPVNAHNVHGNISVNNSNGAIDVETISGTADLKGSFGAVSFSNVSGRVKVEASNAKVRGVSAGEAFVKTSFGQTELQQIAGPLQVENSNGDITVKDVKGYATLSTSFGAIEASGLPKGVHAADENGRITLSDVGEGYAKTSFATVSAQRVTGNLTVENSNGAVNANAVSGDVSAKTTFAAVKFEDIGGKVTVVNQNGSVSVAARAGTSCRNISIKTSFSPIQVWVAENAGYDVSAQTSFGHIQSELPVTASGEMRGETLRGKIGNGACVMTLNNSNSGIEILKAK